jgi:hypothetical protein
MSKSMLLVLLTGLALQPAAAAELSRPSYPRQVVRAIVLPPERHVIEVVHPPTGGSFVINGSYFTAASPACLGWAAGERIRLLAGDWHGRCSAAVFYNMTRRRSCEMWCG